MLSCKSAKPRSAGDNFRSGEMTLSELAARRISHMMTAVCARKPAALIMSLQYARLQTVTTADHLPRREHPRRLSMADFRLISADSHFVEPPTMWAERVDRKFRDRAPHTVKGLGGRDG